VTFALWDKLDLFAKLYLFILLYWTISHVSWFNINNRCNMWCFLACYGDYYMFYLISSWLCEFAWRNNWIFNLYFVSREILDSSEVGIEITWHFYARLFNRITLIQIFDILVKLVWLNILIWYFRQMWSDNLVRCMYFLWTVLINSFVIDSL